MINYIVHITIKEEYIDQFIEVTKEKHKGAREEVGNLEFSVFRDQIVSNKFIIIESYVSDQSIVEHKKSDYYIKWNRAMELYMKEDRYKIFYTKL